MPKVVIINADVSLEDFAEQIQRSIDARFHNYDLTPECRRMSHGLTEAQKGEIETITNYAQHAGDKLYKNGKHIERLLG